MNVFRSLHLALLLATVASGLCAGSEGVQRFTFSEPHMGTLMHITLFAGDEESGAAAADAAFRRIEELNSILSDYDPESELMQLRDSPPGKPVRVSRDLFAVLARAQEISEKTEGSFDVTLGPLVRVWRESRLSGELPGEALIEEARSRIGYRNLCLEPDERTVTVLIPNMRLDLGGIGKGYAADEALNTLRDRGITRALVAAAGDIAIGDPPPGADGWRIGISPVDPRPAGVPEALSLSHRAISTSGDTQQFFEIDGTRYSHIVDPGTGLGLTRRMGVTVIAPDATTADALATALAVMNLEESLALVESLPEVEALIVTAGPKGIEITRSSRFPAGGI